MALKKIVSGGQTGVDRAALDVALSLGIPCGGWCPKGRLAEDGPIPERYPLTETASSQYHIRTRQNVCDSDATLILNIGPLEGGTALTVESAQAQGRPCIIVDMLQNEDICSVVNWLKNNEVSVLNVAGPRASKKPNAYGMACELLQKLLPLVVKLPILPARNAKLCW